PEFDDSKPGTGQRQVEPEVPLSCTHLPASSLFFAISIYSGLSSIPTQSRPCFCATRPVVPLPKNGSRTIPPGGDPAKMHGSIRSGGNTAKCAPLKGRVATVQTVRLLRPLGCLPHEALSNEPPITPAFMPLSERPNLPPLKFG